MSTEKTSRSQTFETEWTLKCFQDKRVSLSYPIITLFLTNFKAYSKTNMLYYGAKNVLTYRVTNLITNVLAYSWLTGHLILLVNDVTNLKVYGVTNTLANGVTNTLA